ncbi:MAG TPA: hypothetical protein VMD91_11585 [Candidatus Sulfotelmatobacter sp.]|nr:hypothetical protein [Candidatus Sulfotelmatobacter sp.]
MTIAVTTDPGGTSVVNQTVALTPTAAGCTSTLASTQCTLTITLPPGSYDASLATYDGANATGNELSAGQLVDFTVAQGQTNTVALTLNGIPTALAVASGAYAVHGSQGAGFTLYGTAAQKLLVQALDADGNVIVGPGAPTFTVASAAGSGFTIANPTTTTPNTLALTPPGTNGSVETFTLTASYGDATCQTSGAVCTASFTVTNDVQTLFAAEGAADQIAEFVPPSTTATASLSSGLTDPVGLVVDGAKNLWVADGADVAEIVPPYTGAPAVSITNGTDSVTGVGVDAALNVYALNSGANNVTKYAPPYTAAPVLTENTASSSLTGLLVDPAGDIFVSAPDLNAVYDFAAPYTTTYTIASGVNNPGSLALDAVGDLFVGNVGSLDVTEFGPPADGTNLLATTTQLRLVALALAGNGDLFVGATGTGDPIAVFAPPYTDAPFATVHLSRPATAMVVDGAGNLFAATLAGTVVEIDPPYTAVTRTYTLAGTPSALALTP